jgi:hypothetical protein
MLEVEFDKNGDIWMNRFFRHTNETDIKCEAKVNKNE